MAKTISDLFIRTNPFDFFMRDPHIEVVVSGKNAHGNEVVLKKATSPANVEFVYDELLALLAKLTAETTE